MTDTVLLVMNPRQIPRCLEAIRGLDVPQTWLTGFTEKELETVIPLVLDKWKARRYAIVSDDTIPTQEALDAVLALHDRNPAHVVTGYCPLATGSPYVNVSRIPPTDETPGENSYLWATRWWATTRRHPFNTYLAGMALTVMTRQLWRRFPFQTYGPADGPGWASDYHLSRRLYQAGIPIRVPPAGLIDHVKEQWNRPDTSPAKRLVLGARTVTYQEGPW
jgi:hypothetical protein